MEAAEPTIREFIAHLPQNEQNEQYSQCAELLCDAAHDYWLECADAGEAPCVESWLDEATILLAMRYYFREQLDEAFDLFHGGAT